MDVTKVILMGTLGIGGAIVTKVLRAFQMNDEADYVKIGTMATVGLTALTCVGDMFDALKGLGK